MQKSTIVYALFQLYELSDEPKRREFLDDLFQFMQKRGNFLFLPLRNALRGFNL